MSEFFKKLKLLKLVWLVINNINVKKWAWRRCRKIFLEAIILHSKNLFFKVSVQIFCHPYGWYHCPSTNHNPTLQCVTCTGVTLFAPVLHLNCFVVSQLESSKSFMYIIKYVTELSRNVIATFSRWITNKLVAVEYVKAYCSNLLNPS